MGHQIKLNLDVQEFKKKLDLKDGKTPIAGIDFPLPKDGKDGESIVGPKGDKGDKGDTTIVEKVIERTEVIKEQPIYNTTEVVKEVTKEITQEDITNIAVQINPIIEYSKIKNAPQWPAGGLSRITKPEVQEMIDAIPAPTSTYADLTDVNMTGLADGNVPVWDDTTGKWLPGVATSTDEKVKYDAADPTAGYLGAKVVAGEGITISEGTGTDANKLKISNTWMLDPVEEYWDITDGLPVAPDVGDRYISDGTDEELGWYDGYIYEWDGEEWIETLPLEGMMVWLIFEMVWWVFMSGGWREEGWDSYVALDQTVPQTFTGGALVGTGLLNVTAGQLGLDTKTYIEAGDIDWATNVPLNETDPDFNAWLIATPPLYVEADTLATVTARGATTATASSFTGGATIGTALTLTAGIDIRPSADSTTAINIAQADGTDFVTFDTTNKRVGIGVTPTRQLDIQGTSAGGSGVNIGIKNLTTNGYSGNIIINDLGTVALAQYAFGSTYGTSYGNRYGLTQNNMVVLEGSGASAFVVGNYDNVPLIFGTNNLERMRILGNGNVGIGTTAPQSILQLAASNTSTAPWLSTFSTTLGHSGNLLFIRSHNATINTKTTTLDTEVLGQISFYGVNSASDYGASAVIAVKQNGAAGASRVPGDLRFTMYSAAGDETLALKIDPSGNIKIPQDSKYLYFGAGDDASIYYNGTDLIIDPKVVGTGVVNLNGGGLTTTGIGTFGTGYFNTIVLGSSVMIVASVNILFGGTDFAVDDVVTFEGGLVLTVTEVDESGTITAVSITNGGSGYSVDDILFGTPFCVMEVASLESDDGEDKITDGVYRILDGDRKLYAYGVSGGESPEPYLQMDFSKRYSIYLAGAKKTNGDTIDNNIFIGESAGLGTDGITNSVFFGTAAGAYATGASGSVFFGPGAGYSAVDAYQSVFFGSQAGDQSSAYSAIFIGVQAGYVATNAYQSVFLGISSGSNATNANSSVFIGYAGFAATNADHSNFIGYLTGHLATNASYSNFFGYYAGYGQTSASHSVFIGTNAGNNNGGTVNTDFQNNLIVDQSILSTNSARTTAAAIRTNALLYGTFADEAASQQLTINAATLTFNSGLNTDLVLNFTGTTTSGVLTWMEDEDRFEFADDVVPATNNSEDLGASDKKWKNIYTFAINAVGINNEVVMFEDEIIFI